MRPRSDGAPLGHGGGEGNRRGVSRAYGPAEVLHDVSFTVEPGELVALTGPSGSGKTTLLQLIGSLDSPTSGRILVDGSASGSLRARRRSGEPRWGSCFSCITCCRR